MRFAFLVPPLSQKSLSTYSHSLFPPTSFQLAVEMIKQLCLARVLANNKEMFHVDIEDPATGRAGL